LLPPLRFFAFVAPVEKELGFVNAVPESQSSSLPPLFLFPLPAALPPSLIFFAASALAAAMSSTKNEATPLVDASIHTSATEKTSLGCSTQMALIISLVSLISIVVVKVQLTAYLFSMASFPTAYSFYSSIVTDVLLIPMFLIFPSQWGVPSLDMFLGPKYTFTLIIIFTTCDMAFTNIALANISITLQQCIAATNPFWTILIETLLHGKCQHPIIYGVVSGLVVGAIFVSISDMKHVNVTGIIFACMAVLCSASKYAFTHAAFRQYKDKLGALSLLFWVDLLMIPIFIPWCLINGELVKMFQANMDFATWMQFTGTAALGGVRALTQFFVLSYTTATSMSIANTFALVLNILISMMWQSHTINAMLVIGIIIVIGTSALYAHLKSSKDACFGILRSKEPPKSEKTEPLARA